MTPFEIKARVARIRKQIQAAEQDAVRRGSAEQDAVRRGWDVSAATIRALARDINALENDLILDTAPTEDELRWDDDAKSSTL